MENNQITPAGFGSLLIGTDRPALIPLARDGDDPQLEHEPRLRSGAYLATIATELDNLTEAIDDDVITSQLEAIVNELLYAQEHYELVRKGKLTI